jgi:hypothetical protein
MRSSVAEIIVGLESSMKQLPVLTISIDTTHTLRLKFFTLGNCAVT